MKNNEYLNGYFLFLTKRKIKFTDEQKKEIEKFLYLYDRKEFEKRYLNFFYEKNSVFVKESFNTSDLIKLLYFEEEQIDIMFHYLRDFELAIKTISIHYLMNINEKTRNIFIKKIFQKIKFESHVEACKNFSFFYKISFGEFFTCLNILSEKDKGNLSKLLLDKNDWGLLDILLNSFRETRNIIAHNNSFLNTKITIANNEEDFKKIKNFLLTKKIVVNDKKISTVKSFDIIKLVKLNINKLTSENIFELLEKIDFQEKDLTCLIEKTICELN